MPPEARILTLSYQNRPFYKREFGCVIRSFEYALQAEATEPEWDLQFGKIDALLNRFGIEAVAEGRRNLAYYTDIQQVLELMVQLQTHETPLGDALRQQQILFTQGDGPFVHRCLDQGKKVLYAKPYHLAALGRLTGTSYLMTLSDSQPRVLGPRETGSKLDLFVLTPRKIA